MTARVSGPWAPMSATSRPIASRESSGCPPRQVKSFKAACPGNDATWTSTAGQSNPATPVGGFRY